MPEHKLIYFNGRGRAEVARLIFVQAAFPFEDVRISDQEWPKIKPCKLLSMRILQNLSI